MYTSCPLTAIWYLLLNHHQFSLFYLPQSCELMKMQFVFFLLVLHGASMATGERYYGGGGRSSYLLEGSEEVMRTDAGEMRMVRGYRFKGWPSAMHIGFITMEPNTLFLPHFMDANLILFVKRGQLRVGRMHKDEIVVKELRRGDIYRIPAGHAFYLMNYGRGQRLHVICSIDTSESLGPLPFQPFFIGGGSYPPSVLSGFDISTLATAFNVTEDEVGTIMGKQTKGPIIYMDEGSSEPKRLERMMRHLHRRITYNSETVEKNAENKKTSEGWTWRNVLGAMTGNREDKKKAGKDSYQTDSYNIYDKNPDFRNTYGWSVAVDEDDYPPLRHSGIGIYLVNLTAGSMMAPHLNPMATEYGIVLVGSGNIQIVFPNGSSAMNIDIHEGDIFWIPRYFPFCQTASRAGPLEFFGFTTSSVRNEPQFLAGASSIFNTMMGTELAAALDVDEEILDEILKAQNESVILPSWPKPTREREEKGEEMREEEEGGREEPQPIVI